jgi:putative ATP-dependent endonuclease of the OLD family
MARIYELKINNFRGINSLTLKFNNKKFICLLGRGDSGKTTILDAISYVLSPNWNLSFYDSDFFEGNVNNSIEIEVSLLDLPEKLIREDMYGLYIRGFDNDGVIQDELHNDSEKVLTIKLEVKKDLEPQWFVINNRQEPIHISANDRAKFNVFMISDYIDRHFSWNKGNPLYSILRENQSSEEEKNSVIIDAIREAIDKIDQTSFSQFKNVTDNIIGVLADFGIDLSNAKTTVDFKDLYIKEGRVCLHDGYVPLRLKGKGTKRLISMAIQTVLVRYGGIILIDEVEQGLEPDRVRNLVRTLKKVNLGQIFITTHSCEVITELEVDDLMMIKNNGKDVTILNLDQKFQDIIRACPEALYAKKVIVCEGKTEIGICRALDTYRKKSDKEYMSFKDCVYILGEGSSFIERAMKLKKLGLSVCVFCDSDDDTNLKLSKSNLEEAGIKIFDCDEGKAIEQQIFQDLPQHGVEDLVNYVLEYNNLTIDQLKQSVKSKYEGDFPDDLMNSITLKMRQAIGEVAKKKPWFKRPDHGEKLGSIIFDCFEEMNDEKIKNQLESLSNWIDE